MSHIQAIYRGGVFQPLEPVDLPEDQRVQLSVGVVPPPDLRAWLREAGELCAAIVQRHGILPDSASEIAADRHR
jgi:predicted DNA-binding antitoxin AbrB/MazE fold protein